MGGCRSRSIDSEAMAADIDYSSAEERSAGNQLAQNNAGQVPAQGGSSEYIGAFMRDDMAQQNAVEPTSQDNNNQTVQPVPRVSSDFQHKRSEITADVLVENMAKASVDQPLNQIFGEQPMVEQAVHNQVIEEQPVTLPVPNNQIQKTLPISSVVQYGYQNVKEPVFDVPVETTVKTLDEPGHKTFEENSIVERTSHDQIIEQQPVYRQTVPNQIYEEHPVHPLSPGDHAVLPEHPYATQASTEVKGNVQVVETQQAGHDLGVVFEGRTYRTRVFDPNLNEYVYVGGNDLRPRGGLVM